MCPPVSTRRFASHARATPRTTIVSETPRGGGRLERRTRFLLAPSSSSVATRSASAGFLSAFPRPRAAFGGSNVAFRASSVNAAGVGASPASACSAAAAWTGPGWLGPRFSQKRLVGRDRDAVSPGPPGSALTPVGARRSARSSTVSPVRAFNSTARFITFDSSPPASENRSSKPSGSSASSSVYCGRSLANALEPAVRAFLLVPRLRPSAAAPLARAVDLLLWICAERVKPLVQCELQHVLEQQALHALHLEDLARRARWAVTAIRGASDRHDGPLEARKRHVVPLLDIAAGVSRGVERVALDGQVLLQHAPSSPRLRPRPSRSARAAGGTGTPHGLVPARELQKVANARRRARQRLASAEPPRRRRR